MDKHGREQILMRATVPDAASLSPFELAASHHAVTPGSTYFDDTVTEPVIMQRQKQRNSITMLFTACFRSSSLADTDSILTPSSSSQNDVVPDLYLYPVDAQCKAGPLIRRSSSPRKHYQGGSSLKRASSGAYSAYSEAEWHDAASHFSGSMDQDQSSVEELVQLVKELGAFKAPWIPDPPLAFGTPDMQFVPVPAVTGFSAYWLKDDVRTTPFPQPIDVMLKASYLVQKVHASIAGILIEETPTQLGIIAKPGFLPPFLGFNGYAELYDKSNAEEPSWMPRRDLKMGKGYGKLYMTADGMLIARVWQKPAFSDKVDVIMEEYMRLEQGGEVIVDRMTCLHVESGKRATQLQVGFRRPVPKGMSNFYP